MFDIEAAIADLDTRGFGYADHGYRTTMALTIERNPALAEPLRRIADVLEDVEAHGNPAELKERVEDLQADARLWYSLADEANRRFAQLRDMALTLAKMDEIDPELLKTLASKADEGQDYMAKRMEEI